MLHRFLEIHAARLPDKIFWRQLAGDTVTEFTFADLRARACSFAHAYRDSGLAPGQVALIFLPHGFDAVTAFFGAMLAGVVPSFMPCPSAKQPASVYWPAHRALLRRIGPHALVTDRRQARQMQEHGLAAAAQLVLAIETVADGDRPAPPHTGGDEDAVALLQHSSGTTSLKKGVALSHRAILRQVDAYASRLGMGQADNIVSWLPLYHDMGLVACTVMPVVLGQTVTTIDPFQWAARPSALLAAIERYQGHFVWMPNFAFEHLVRAVPDDFIADLSQVRAFINCSEPCKPETFERFARRYARLGLRAGQLQVCYAMAETVFAVTQTDIGREPLEIVVDTERLRAGGVAVQPVPGAAGTRLLSAGPPLLGMQARIRGELGEWLDDGHVGEIVLSGAFLFDGYFNDSETTWARLRDGLYASRDLGFLRGGELFVLGRKDDLLIVNGRNLHAHEVEAIVAGVAGLKPGRAVAFGVFLAESGSERLIVVAERDPGAASGADAALARAVRDAVFAQTNIEVSQCRIVAPGWLLKTSSGKVSREANRARYLRELAPAPEDFAASDPTFADVAGFVARWFKQPVASIRRDTVAADIEGWDSLGHSALILGIEKAFGVRFADSEVFAFASVGDLAARIEALAHGPRGLREAPDRVVHKSQAASIVRLGDGEGPDLIVFAGYEQGFGALELLDFASVFANSAVDDTTKYFVTDHCRDWYTTCFGAVAAKLNEISRKPKILFGNSMGGYAALRFATALDHVVAVLSLVPQTSPPPRFHGRLRGDRTDYQVRFVPGVEYCVLFGAVEDEAEKADLRAGLADPSRQRIVIVPSCGHNLAPFLNQQGLLRDVIECCVRPETMADEIERITAAIETSAVALAARAEQVRQKQARRVATMAANAADDSEGPAGHEPAAGARPGELREKFVKANVAGDGHLTLDEAKAGLPQVARAFARIDTEKRGYVTFDQVRAFRRSQAKQRKAAG